ncbi:MAG: AgmX/PglI C-terminal domain-containing protein [Acidobacteria bacterium]|nr:AgmX/PglI C-terminal domain-containing protein [Acidobacteriota bacterium]
MESDRPDDGVMVDTMGSLDGQQVRNTFQNIAPSLMGCYQQGLARLPYLAGDVQFHVGVAIDGAVKWAFIETTQLGDHAAQQCMLEVIRRTTFPRPTGGESETVVPLALEPPGAVSYPATWTPNQVSAAVAAHQMELDACLDGSSGYTLTLYVAAGGTVQSAGATPPDADHQDQADCIVAASATWVLDDPGPAGAKVTLEF